MQKQNQKPANKSKNTRKPEPRPQPRCAERPVIYQLLPRLFTNYTPAPVPNGTIITNGSGKMNAITPLILSEIRSMGFTHVWYTGVIEHANQSDYTRYGIPRDNPHIVKGKAGSPYAIKDYYDIDPDIAVNVPRRMAEFEALVSRTHAAGLKAIIDFVPNPVARVYHSDAAPEGVVDLGANDDTDMFFNPNNNFYYIPRQQFSPSIPLGTGPDRYVEFPAKCTGNDCFTAYPGPNDWYETVKLNYGFDPGNRTRHFWPIPDTWHKMLHILLFWAAKGIDGFRCDMAHMVPLEFWEWAVPQVKQRHPHIIFIAEAYNVALYRPMIERGCFDYLYDKVTLYDTLRGIQCHDTSAAQLTSCWQTVEGISDHMLTFLENHDEQRYASKQYAGNPWMAVPAMVAAATMSRAAVMVYMAQELGEPAADAEGFSGLDGRTTIFDYWSLATLRRWLNEGKADGAALTDSEKRLRQFYSRLMHLVNDEPALRCGGFFDVTYANYHNPDFNPHRQYAYLRHVAEPDGTVSLVLAMLNFDSRPTPMRVVIPQHAFDHIGIRPVAAAPVPDLLTGATLTASLSPDEPVTALIPAFGAVLLHFQGLSIPNS